MAREQRSDKIAIVTVHGTNDQTPGEGGHKKWWEPASAFCTALQSRLAARGVDCEVVPHVWNGANSALARERGAESLASTIKTCARRYAGVHVIGHSHGGNVAAHAAELVGWGLPRRRQHMASLMTVGTPFFKSRFGGREVFGAFAFLALTLVSALTLPTLTFFSVRARLAGGDPQQYAAQMTAVGVILAISLVAFYFVFPLALRGVRRVVRFRSRGAASATALAVWHPNDEAIAFLRRMEGFNMRPLPPWSFFRGSRGLGVTVGIWVVLIAAILSALWAAANFALVWLADLGVLQHGSPLVAGAWDPARLFALLGVTLGGALALFGLVYVAVRLAFAVADLATMPWLNGLVLSRVRGMAFGNDGDQNIGEVSTTPHTHPAREVVLEGAYAERLRENAAHAAAELLDRYRWALFTVESDASHALAQLAIDTMTWKSLVHTTYFDHDEMADLAANHVLATTKPA